jgi:hypothetical protein
LVLLLVGWLCWFWDVARKFAATLASICVTKLNQMNESLTTGNFHKIRWISVPFWTDYMTLINVSGGAKNGINKQKHIKFLHKTFLGQ